MLKHSKIMLVAIVSAVVAIFTTLMGGITGGIIGSVVSSVLYNVLVEVFEEPVNKVSSKKSFEWELAYIFPLIVIAIIQVILIFAILARIDILPNNLYLLYYFIQDLTDYNLFRITGISLLIMSVYPFLLNAKVINKSHGLLLSLAGVILLARGFSDLNFEFAYIIRTVYNTFNLSIAIFTLIILLYVISHILFKWLNNKSNKETIPTQKYNLREKDYYNKYSNREKEPYNNYNNREKEPYNNYNNRERDYYNTNRKKEPYNNYNNKERDYYNTNRKKHSHNTKNKYRNKEKNHNHKIIRKNKNKQFNEGSNNIHYDSSSHYKYRK